jgi:hypothetical protein
VSVRTPARAFVLLDVILSIMILSIVVLTALRAFTQSVHAVRTSDIAARAAMYAEAKLQELELQPPEDRRHTQRGAFADETMYRDGDLFPDAQNYFWEADFEEEQIRYPHVRLARRDQDRMLGLTRVTLRVTYDDGPGGDVAWTPVVIDTYLMGNERFSAKARQANDLF